jgi:hypothetical protein
MSYQPMPPAPQGGGPPPAARDPRNAPSTVQNAVRLMFLLAALGLIGLIIVFADKSALRKAVEDANPNFDTSQVDNAVNTGVTVGAVIGVVLIVLYVLLALQVRKGKNWARIVTWVLAGLGVLGGITNLAQPQAALTKVIAGIELVLYVVLIVLLAMRPSNDYFRKPTYQY